MAATVEAACRWREPVGPWCWRARCAPAGVVGFDPENVVRRMLTIRGVHNYHPRDLATAMAFLAGPGRDFRWQSLVVAGYPLEQAENAFADAHAQPGVRIAVFPGFTQKGRV